MPPKPTNIQELDFRTPTEETVTGNVAPAMEEALDPPNGADEATRTTPEQKIVDPVARVQKFIAEKVQPVAEAELSQSEDREDPWDSLGGGRNTYHREGHLPTGREQDITVTSRYTSGKQRQLVHRVTLGNRFIDVPVNEHVSNQRSIEAAKKSLIKGGGTRLRPPKNKKK